MRVFLDSSGVRWIVSERDAAHVPGGLARRCLIFESAAAVRRVWSFPDSWRELTDEQLAALSWKR
ncbi:MAG TPA: hypothetical protein VFY16_02170 [Gemmatimonadaceae bacterium]|nr:hypothetical protein [Gemmatimonadaceae bacterium]